MDEADQHRTQDHEAPDPQHPQAEGTGKTPAAEESFGDARVDAAVARSDGLHDRPVEEHVEVFDEIHRSFREALDDPEADGGSGA